MVTPYSLYFHIPFCTKKCDYCHFFVLPDKEPFKHLYFEALEKEWHLKKHLIPHQGLTSIYFGGGTPSLLPTHLLEKILHWIPCSLDSIEITLEINPESTSLQHLRALKSIGINRISIGLQSLNDTELTHLSRNHTSAQSKNVLFDCAEAGFENVSIDLMIDTPFQTLESCQQTLLQLKDLPFTHLSLYNLTIEKHTVFYKKRQMLEKAIPPQELSSAIFQLALNTIPQLGLKRYEISAFAKPGFHSRHNMGYWTCRPFLGFGPSASSYWDKSRFRNISHLHRYCKAVGADLFPTEFSETLSLSAQLKEEIALGLRLTSGIDLKGRELSAETIETFNMLKDKNLLMQEETKIRLTEQGLQLHDWVASELVEI